MKHLLPIILMQTLSAAASDCGGFESPDIQQLIKTSMSLAHYMTDEGHKNMRKFPSEQQKKVGPARMIPIDPAKGVSDYRTTGKIKILSPTGEDVGHGTGFKISGSCVLTSAHLLYNQKHAEVKENGRNIYRNSIQFIWNDSSTVRDAEIFYQMTEEGIDFKYKDGKPEFNADSDLVVLRLRSSVDSKKYYSDPYYEKLNILSPAEIIEGMNFELGRRIRCVGLPYYKISKSYGSCKGSDFLWQHDDARVFEWDKLQGLGTASNVASGSGMSGGHCSLKDVPTGKIGQVFAVVQGGWDVWGFDRAHNPLMPDVYFRDREYINGNATHLSLLHVLNQRMTQELGFGLGQIVQKCK